MSQQTANSPKTQDYVDQRKQIISICSYLRMMTAVFYVSTEIQRNWLWDFML